MLGGSLCRSQLCPSVTCRPSRHPSRCEQPHPCCRDPEAGFGWPIDGHEPMRVLFTCFPLHDCLAEKHPIFPKLFSFAVEPVRSHGESPQELGDSVWDRGSRRTIKPNISHSGWNFSSEGRSIPTENRYGLISVKMSGSHATQRSIYGLTFGELVQSRRNHIPRRVVITG